MATRGKLQQCKDFGILVNMWFLEYKHPSMNNVSFNTGYCIWNVLWSEWNDWYKSFNCHKQFALSGDNDGI